MLSIIDRYILREVTKSFLAITLILLLVLAGSGYMRFLGEAAAGNLSQDVMLKLVGVEALRVSGAITPPAFFLSILYTLGQMQRHSEMTALAACGIGTLRIFRAVLLAAVPVTLMVTWLSLDLRPWANAVNEVLFKERDLQSEFNSAVAGRFNEFNQGDLVFYVGEISDDRTRLKQVFVQNRQHGVLGLIVSEEGYRYVDEETGESYVVLNEGRRYEGIPGYNSFTIGEFAEYGLKLNIAPEHLPRTRVRSMPTSSLLESDDISYRVELEYRFMLPTAVLVFTVISIPLSYGLPREGIYGRLVLAILFYLLFINLMALSGAWMESGTTPAWMGRWWVHPLMLLLTGLVVYYRSNHFSRILQRSLR